MRRSRLVAGACAWLLAGCAFAPVHSQNPVTVTHPNYDVGGIL